MFKSGFIAIVGKPNAGKSTLLNALVGQKVSIVSPKTNTTRNQIRGILNEGDAQYIFVDTPGFLKTENKFTEVMRKTISQSMVGVDIILFLTPFWKEIDLEYLKKIDFLKNKEVKKYVLLTQIDKQTNKEDLLEAMAKLGKSELFDEIIPISAYKRINLDALLKQIKKDLPEGIPYYDVDKKTDYSEEFLVSEIVREKALMSLQEEIPHKLFVKTLKIQKKSKIYQIDCEITIERDSHKSIIIGKNGQMIKEIGMKARKELEEIFRKPVYLDLYVKVKEDWMNKESVYKQIIE